MHELSWTSSALPPAAAGVTSADVAPSEACWYAFCTRSRHEKMVAQQLVGKSIEHFLPLYRSLRRWQSRTAEVDLPLFPGYVFARLPLRERFAVLGLPGVAYLVQSGGYALPVPALQLESIRHTLAAHLLAEPHPFLVVGARVRVKHGPLAGWEGVLLRKQGRCRLVLSIEMIMRSIVVDVSAADVEPAAPAPAPLRGLQMASA